VVEDEAIIAMDIERSLMQIGYTVSVAHSGPEAIACAETTRPDLALMDIMLADGPDGIETAEYLRARFGVPSIYLTANGDDEIIERAKRTQPAGYLLKPFRERELHTTIQMAITRISLEREMRQRDQWRAVVLHSMRDPVITVAKDRTVLFMNQAAEEMVGCAPDAAAGQDCAKLLPVPQSKRAELARRLTQAVEEGVVVEMADLELERAGDAGGLFVGDSISPMLDEQGSVVGAVVVYRALAGPPGVSAIQAAGAIEQPAKIGFAARLDPMGQQDPLTGLPARAQAEQALELAIRRRRRTFAAMVTVDRFEALRSRFGNTVADEVLLFMSLHLAQDLAAGDRLFRWSGPSFLILLDRMDALEEVRGEIARLTSMKLERLFHLKTRAAVVAVSGTSTLVQVFLSESVDDVIAQFDRAICV
jgi:diguanylate cyclase (GGDEF)-like protein/PAS domain S-box-containing protein